MISAPLASSIARTEPCLATVCSRIQHGITTCVCTGKVPSTLAIPGSIPASLAATALPGTSDTTTSMSTFTSGSTTRMLFPYFRSTACSR
eukprot:CAMPEP_0204343572 /NCGR_PEP_ID=MMETSP0469-20131031/24997_1 /ASSEMBLY_ACC=CAM_ASM_000384 /TAXON_ID=2969 /ORGANISM="Oxyrrhis marina" /LENGTH=89 /DNA_ID=CAMNT_0051328699 /DNA_START=469 /DNA_END=735 /DNA_ORIENTATION=-